MCPPLLLLRILYESCCPERLPKPEHTFTCALASRAAISSTVASVGPKSLPYLAHTLLPASASFLHDDIGGCSLPNAQKELTSIECFPEGGRAGRGPLESCYLWTPHELGLQVIAHGTQQIPGLLRCLRAMLCWSCIVSACGWGCCWQADAWQM